MKISLPVIFASTVSALPVNTPPERRNSQELIETSMVSKNLKTDSIEQSADIEAQFASVEEFNDYMESLNDMPDSEWEEKFNELEKTLQDFYGLSVDALENMTEEEFDSLIDNLQF